MTHADQRYRRRRHKNEFSSAQQRVLRALAEAERPCTAADLTDRGLMAPTVLTLGCLMREQLVRSEVVRRPDAERPIPFYVLTDKGKDVVAQLVATTPAAQHMVASAPPGQ